MKIDLYQHGGIAGDRIRIKEINDNDLNSLQKDALRSMIENADFFNIESDQTDKSIIGADLLTYEIIIEDGGQKSIVHLIKTEKNTPLEQLLNSLLTTY